MAYSSSLANYLLFTPFDNKSNVDNEVSNDLTVHEFFENCYVQPDFDDEKLYDHLIQDVPEGYDYVCKYDSLSNEMALHKTEEETFFNWINDNSNSKVYTISGNAGVGKTTYINGLKYFREKSTNERWTILNVDTAHNKISWFGDTETYINFFEKSVQKMYAIVLNEIQSLLFGHIKDNTYDIDKIYINLKKFCAVYKKFFSNNYQKGRRFFNGITEIIEKYNDTSLEGKINLLEEVAQYLSDYFTNIDNNKKSEFDPFCTSLDILIMILRCKNENEIEFKRIILFDNLERFIASDEIFNEELENIRKNLITYSNELYGVNNFHKGLIKIVMVMRNNSARMCGAKVHSADDLASDLNLDGWFVTNLIIDNKVDWLRCHGSNKILKKIEYLEQITGDLRKCEDSTLTGLSLQINPMFNNNKRLIIDFVGTCIEMPSSKSLLDTYNELWSVDKPIYRFAARSIIRSLLISELASKDNLFNHLKVYSERKPVGLGYSRKLLTILYNNNAKEYPLLELFSEYFCINDVQDF